MPNAKRATVDVVDVTKIQKSQKLENVDSQEKTLPELLAFSPRLPRVVLTPHQALKFCKDKLQNPRQLSQVFDELYDRTVIDKSCNVGLSSANRRKNRYDEIVPFDEDIVLTTRGGDYINASFVTHRFTYEDFGEMVIQYRCPVVIM